MVVLISRGVGKGGNFQASARSSLISSGAVIHTRRRRTADEAKLLPRRALRSNFAQRFLGVAKFTMAVYVIHRFISTACCEHTEQSQGYLFCRPKVLNCLISLLQRSAPNNMLIAKAQCNIGTRKSNSSMAKFSLFSGSEKLCTT